MEEIKNIDDVFMEFIPALERIANETETYPIEIGEKYGLTESGELSDEDKKKAKQEWKGIILKISFLITECNEKTCTLPLMKRINNILDLRLETMEKMKTIADTNSEEYVALKQKFDELDDEYVDASREIGIYWNNCKNEVFDLLKYWWWDLKWF